MKKIKRTFLVSAEIQRWLKKYESSTQKIEQFYTLSNGDERCCYHKLFPDTSTKIMVDAEGNETVTPVTEVIYLSQREHHLGRIITKQSYRVMLDTCSFVIDKYLKNSAKGKKDNILLLSKSDEKKAIAFLISDLPVSLEITEDKSSTNKTPGQLRDYVAEGFVQKNKEWVEFDPQKLFKELAGNK